MVALVLMRCSRAGLKLANPFGLMGTGMRIGNLASRWTQV
jgi:hypothetical protein